ncbi:hypothetical protein [Pantoea ananatis]|uniref:hypothetical protein n=1 Tax=Pantoea ananas TaxID=553 RepID=UPI00351D2A33
MTLFLPVDQKNIIIINCCSEIRSAVKNYYPSASDFRPPFINHNRELIINVSVEPVLLKRIARFKNHRTINYKDDIQLIHKKCDIGKAYIISSEAPDYCYHIDVNFPNPKCSFSVFISSLAKSIYVIRFIRALIADIHYLSGRKCYHAALVNYRNKGILIVGDSGSGKTSLTFHLAGAGGKVLSNDKLFIGYDVEGKPAAWPHVTSFRLGGGLLRNIDNQRLLRLISDRSGSAKSFLSEIDQIGDYWGNKKKFELTPAEMNYIFDSQIIDHSPVDLIVFSRRSDLGCSGSIQPSQLSSHSALLNANYFSVRDPDYPESIFGNSSSVSSTTNVLHGLSSHSLHFNPYNGLSYVTDYLDRL